MHEQCSTAFGLFLQVRIFCFIAVCFSIKSLFTIFFTFSYTGDEHLLYAVEQFQSKLLWATRLARMSLPNFAEYFRH